MQRLQKRWMHQAFTLANRGLGQTWPNPSVGCVIVKDGRLVGRGRTGVGGTPHAEIIALQQAQDRAKNADAYVTLEPCAHYGRTGPCAIALIEAGVRRVAIAQSDPDIRVNGAGIRILRDAKIEVVENFSIGEAPLVNSGFLKRVNTGLPTVTLKLATTLDGKIAMSNGESRWITGSAARRMTHMLRSRHDAILVGRNTIDRDDPDLRVRNLGRIYSPIRVVLDTNLSISNDSRLVRTAAENPVWIIHGDAADGDRKAAKELNGISLLPTKTVHGKLNLVCALNALGERGITRVLCEGGSQAASSLLKNDLVDEIAWFQAGKLIGQAGQSAIGELNFTSLAQVPQFNLRDVQYVGPDTVSFWSKA